MDSLEIKQKLVEVEHASKVRILLAVEWGSRAWGYAGPNSDWDVRFLYCRPLEEYLRLEETSDVLQSPAWENLDMEGWDITKFLRLLHKSNQNTFEWLDAPIVYRNSAFAEELRQVKGQYFNPIAMAHSYQDFAEHKWKIYMQDPEVKVKRCLVILRAILMCRWVLERGTMPPLTMDPLMDACLEPERMPLMQEWVQGRRAGTGPELVVLEEDLRAWFETVMADLKQQTAAMRPEKYQMPPRGWEKLDELFLHALRIIL